MTKKNATIEVTATEPKASINKTQAIKDALKAHPQKGPAELSAMLVEQGMQISAAYISTIKSSLKQKRGAGRAKLASSAAPSNEQWLATLIAAKKLAAQLGGVEAAKQALDALSKLAN